MSNTNTPPLHLAVQNGNIEIVKTLLARGYDLNTRNADGLTPLDLAIATNNTAITQLLLEHEDKVRTASKNGQIPSSTGIANKLFEQWKDGAVMTNTLAVVFLFVLYGVWSWNLPTDTTFYEANIAGLEDYRNYLQVVVLFGIANAVAPFLHLAD